MGDPSNKPTGADPRGYKSAMYWPLYWLAMAATLAFWAFLVTAVFAPVMCPTGLSNYAAQRMDQPGTPSYCLVTREMHRSHIAINTVEPRFCSPSSADVEQKVQTLRTQAADSATECRKQIVLIVPAALKRMAVGLANIF